MQKLKCTCGEKESFVARCAEYWVCDSEGKMSMEQVKKLKNGLPLHGFMVLCGNCGKELGNPFKKGEGK